MTPVRSPAALKRSPTPPEISSMMSEKYNIITLYKALKIDRGTNAWFWLLQLHAAVLQQGGLQDAIILNSTC